PVEDDAAPLAAGAPIAGRSRTLPVDGRARSFEKNASASVHAKKTPAHTAVERDRKFALPVAPNRLPDAPLPNEAPMSAPLPCCTSTRPIITSADTTCATSTRLRIHCIVVFSESILVAARLQPAALQMAVNSAAFNEAPPTSPPSMSVCANSACALSALTLPP